MGQPVAAVAAEQYRHSKILTRGSVCREGGWRSRADCRQQGKVSSKSSLSRRGSASSLQSPRPDGDPQERAGSKIHLPPGQGAVLDMHNTLLQAGEEQSFGLSPGLQRELSALAKPLESTEVSDSSFSPVIQLLPGLSVSPPAPTEGQRV